jgi:hypothetical protein
MFRLKLMADGLSIDSTQSPTDTLQYLPGYRLRNVTVAPSGDTLFVAVDNSCCTLGPHPALGNSVASPDPGFILRMVYLTTLALHDTAVTVHEGNGSAYYEVFPNPASNILYVRGKTGARKPLYAQLYDITGKPVMEKTASDDDFYLDVHGLSPGIYILRLSDGYGISHVTEKITIL